MKKHFTVGRNDFKDLTKEQSGINKIVKRRCFSTMKDAEDFIDNHLHKIDPIAVERGDFYLDAPEKTN